MYFKPEVIEKGFGQKRREYLTVTWDKAGKDGFSEVTYSGVLCQKGNSQFMLNISDSIQEPVFKGIPHDRVKQVVYKGTVYKPKAEKIGQLQHEEV